DVTDRKSVEVLPQNLPQAWQDIDILVNNAGLARGVDLAQDADLSDWEEVIDTNNKGLVYMTRTLLPSMLKRNHGHIINIGSIAGSWPYKGGNVYGASKAFVRQFSLNLRTDLHGTALRVTNIEPGLVGETEFSYVRFRGDENKAQELYKNTQALTPEDIAESIYWASAQPKHVNVNSIEIMPVAQTYAGLIVDRHP
ncbi:MAG: SDR family NAD(P)-dependent oxidoreductase, partial [Bdellovibrionaceae bacterium]|nr:SDR family NAD(P)-dependent oxidoreductase [Pseudobdellovibrionaceae bacterium]